MQQLRVFQQPPLKACLERVVGLKVANSDITVLPNTETGVVAPPPIKHTAADQAKTEHYLQVSHCPGRDSCPSFHLSADLVYVGLDTAMLCANRRVAAEYIKFLNYMPAGKIS
jgi:hypothetical protein